MFVNKLITLVVGGALLLVFSPEADTAPNPQQVGNEPFSPPVYSYSYEAVDSESGNQFGHGEERDGDVTRGEYRVLMADGKTQIVRYTVTAEGGYQADVTYEKK